MSFWSDLFKAAAVAKIEEKRPGVVGELEWLIAESQNLGREIDALRLKRQELSRKIAALVVAKNAGAAPGGAVIGGQSITAKRG